MYYIFVLSVQSVGSNVIPSLKATILKNEKKVKPPKKLVVDRKRLAMFEKFVDPSTSVPFFLRVQFKKIDGKKQPVSFYCSKANNAYEQSQEILTALLERDVSWYDGRKSAVNIITFFIKLKLTEKSYTFTARKLVRM